jgi:hypothetical protein
MLSSGMLRCVALVILVCRFFCYYVRDLFIVKQSTSIFLLLLMASFPFFPRDFV